ncbi:MAG TPA: diaminopropionate ammonia-lyase [Ktedonobacterales bacterium]|nr:diaminopropionate ammonia-lyase [Ktedonobacterales bacterium]
MPDNTIVFANPQATQRLEGEIPGGEAFDFHQKLPGYRQSPLIDAPGIAEVLGVGKVWVKDESSRFGLPAFKFLGASWAVYRALLEQSGGSIEPWQTFDDLKERFALLKPLTLVAATDGNHGRAVARMARLLGFASHILVPRGMAQARIDAIKGEGAEVTTVDGSYDDAVTQAAALAADDALVISDTAWEGYTRIPRWIMEGYTTILRELDDQLTAAGDSRVDLVAAQMGVGGLATAVVWRYRRPELVNQPKIVGVEPLAADAILQSARAGRMVEVPGPHTSIMAGLCCGVPSLVAWPIISRGIDVFVAIDDEWAREAMRALARAGVVSGETGAAGLAGLLALLSGPEREQHRQLLGLTPASRMVVISTEGATDPVAYQRIVG